ncbi:hypothetical protein DFA_10085 [Cavenderia fasciculata]|uniref:Uncharacterized protein n=1 Tax=Cavenderia fasciculata TaxID=261658 RepID=F4Q982_CACFS|nr:uncharacterized protein DFA_10085 [Cavenderia fasciculata]EGG15251.1 hypothetical protein DFA_10085 [Cavenderia fasciculata]|eukprot:XP_004351971.1 hypothetical protein DFA_10085 [Cavenderia fasciculata]
MERVVKEGENVEQLETLELSSMVIPITAATRSPDDDDHDGMYKDI